MADETLKMLGKLAPAGAQRGCRAYCCGAGGCRDCLGPWAACRAAAGWQGSARAGDELLLLQLLGQQELLGQAVEEWISLDALALRDKSLHLTQMAGDLAQGDAREGYDGLGRDGLGGLP